MNWSTNDLMQFLEMVHQNQQGNCERFPEAYNLIQRVDNCFVVAAENLVNPKPVTTGILFLRSQYAYKAAAGMALAGQVIEAFPMMRLCLESAGYALAIFAEPTKERVFLDRHVNDASMRAQKQNFNIPKIIPVISGFDAELAQIFKGFYDRTIELGAHPNPYGILNAMKWERQEDSASFTALALTTNCNQLLHAMKNNAQVGLTSLFIFDHIFKEKFALLGIREEMDTLRREHL